MKDRIVAMPFIGLFSFLPIWVEYDGFVSVAWQCPLSGFFHFYPVALEALILAACRARFCK